MLKKTGYLDSRRMRQGGLPHWPDAPFMSIPGAMISYSVFEEFMGEGAVLAGNGVLPMKSGTWYLTEAADITTAYADAAGGIFTLTCGGVNEDGGQVSLGGVQAGGGAFWLAAGKTLWFEVRAAVSRESGTDEMNAFFGIIDPTAAEWLTDAGGALTIIDFAGWLIQDGGANWGFVGNNAGAEDINDCGVACDYDADYHYFGFMVDGVTSITAYFDRVAIAAGAIATANIPVTGLMPGFAIKAGSATAEILSIDYLMCVQLR